MVQQKEAGQVYSSAILRSKYIYIYTFSSFIVHPVVYPVILWMVISFYRLCGQRKQVSNVEMELFVQYQQIPADFVTLSCKSETTPQRKQRYIPEKNAQRKIKCKTSVTSNSLKLDVLLAKTYTCYDVSYVLYTVCTVLMEYMYTVQVLLLCLLIKVSEIKIIVWLFFYNKPLVQRVFNLQ